MSENWHEDFEDETTPPEIFEEDFNEDYEEEDFFDDEREDNFRDDVEADADVLRNCGWGTDEDYGCYDDYGDW